MNCSALINIDSYCLWRTCKRTHVSSCCCPQLFTKHAHRGQSHKLGNLLQDEFNVVVYLLHVSAPSLGFTRRRPSCHQVVWVPGGRGHLVRGFQRCSKACNGQLGSRSSFSVCSRLSFFSSFSSARSFVLRPFWNSAVLTKLCSCSRFWFPAAGLWLVDSQDFRCFLHGWTHKLVLKLIRLQLINTMEEVES